MLQMELMKSTRNEGTGGLPCSFFIIRRCRLMRVTASITSCLQREFFCCLLTTIKGKRGSVRKRSLSATSTRRDSRVLIRQQSYRPNNEGTQHSQHCALGEIVARHVVSEFRDARHSEESSQRDEYLEWVEEHDRPKDQNCK